MLLNSITNFVKVMINIISLLVDNCQKPGKSGSTRVYQGHQAFNQTFGASIITLMTIENRAL